MHQVKEFPSYSSANIDAYKESLWMDECITLLWDEKVLKPCVQDAPLGVIPIILLDSQVIYWDW